MFVAPDPQYALEVRHWGAGACCSDHTEIWLKQRWGPEWRELEEVASAEGAARPHVRWTGGRNAVVFLCNASRYTVSSRTLLDPPFVGDRENAIFLHVVTHDAPAAIAPACAAPGPNPPPS